MGDLFTCLSDTAEFSAALKANKFDVKSLNSEKQNIFHAAADTDNAEIIAALCDAVKGTDTTWIDIKDIHGSSVLEKLVQMTSAEGLKACLAANIVFNLEHVIAPNMCNSVSEAIRQEREDMAEAILKYAIDNKLPFPTGQEDLARRCSIYYACESKQLKAIEYICELGEVDLFSPDIDDSTPFDKAVEGGDEVVGHLFSAMLKNKRKMRSDWRDQYGENMLFKCTRRNCKQAITKMFESGMEISLDETDNEGRTPLLAAAMEGNGEVGMLILEETKRRGLPIDVNMRDKIGNTALGYSLQNNCVQLVMALLSFEEIETSNVINGLPLLHAAVRAPNPDFAFNMTESLLKIFKVTFISEISRMGPIDSARSLSLKVLQEQKQITPAEPADEPPEGPPLENEVENTGENTGENTEEGDAEETVISAEESPFLAACRQGRVPVIECFTSEEVLPHSSVDDVNSMEQTCLMAALDGGSYDAAKYLLRLMNQKKIKNTVNIQDCTGNFPLLMSIDRKNAIMTKTLLGMPNVDLDLMDKKNRTPFLAAFKSGNLDLVKNMVNFCKSKDMDLNINVKDPTTGEPPIFDVIDRALSGDKSLLQLFLDIPGIDINVQKENGMSVVAYAVHAAPMRPDGSIDPGVAETILTSVLENHPRDFDFSVVDDNGYNALYWCTDRGLTDLVKIILQFPSFDIKSAPNKKALDRALTANPQTNTTSIPIVERMLNDTASKTPIDINAFDENGSSLFEKALMGNHINLIKMLIKAEGINLNKVNSEEKTALEVAMKASEGNSSTPILIMKTAREKKVHLNVNTQDPETLQSPVHLAVERNQLDVVMALLEFGHLSLNLKNNRERTAIVEAVCQRGDMDIAKTLLSSTQTRNINLKDKVGNALYHAIDRNELELVKILMDMPGIDLDGVDANGRTAAHVALEGGHIEILREILGKAVAQRMPLNINHMDPEHGTILHQVCKRRLLEVLQKIVNFPQTDLNLKDPNGDAAIHIILKQWDITALETLLEYTGNINLGLPDSNMQTPLHLAAIYCEKPAAAVKLLLNKERKKKNKTVDTNARDQDGCKVLYYAIRKQYVEVVEMLVRVPNIHLNLINKAASTSLEVALEEWNNGGSSEIVGMLLQSAISNKRKLNVNTQNSQGWTPLHYAVHHNNPLIASLLLEDPALDPNIVDGEGRTSLIWAIAMGHEEIAGLILSGPQTKDVNLQDSEGSALHHAIVQSMDNVVEQLVGFADIDLNNINSGGMTAPQKALSMDRLSCLIIILREGIAQERENVMDVNVENSDGSGTLLHQVVRRQLHSVLKEMIPNKSVEWNVKSAEGTTAFHIGIEKNDIAALRLLLESESIDLTCTNNNGESPVHLAIHHMEAPEELIADMIAYARGNKKKLDVNYLDCYKRTGLYYAIVGVQVEAVKLLVEYRDTDVNRCDEHQHTALEIATEAGDMETILAVLSKSLASKKKLNVNTTEEDTGYSPMHFAVERMQASVVEMLLSFDSIDLDIMNKKSRTALIEAICHESNDTTVASAILASGRPMNLLLQDEEGSALYHAIMLDMQKVVTELLDCYGRTLDSTLNGIDAKNRNAAKVALDEERFDCLNIVLRKSAEKRIPLNVNTLFNGKSLLHQVVVLKLHRAVKYTMLVPRVDVNKLDSEGNSAIHLAMMESDLDGVDHLVDSNRIHLNILNGQKKTPLHLAVTATHDPTRAVKLMIGRATKQATKSQPAGEMLGVDIMDGDGCTALYYAIKQQLTEVVELLVEMALLDKVNAAGETAIDVAVDCWSQGGHEEIVELVLDGAVACSESMRINTRDKNGYTALRWAVEKQSLEVISKLMNFPHVNLDLKCHGNMTAISRAVVHDTDPTLPMANLILLKAREKELKMSIMEVMGVCLQQNRVDLVSSLLEIGDLLIFEEEKICEFLKIACHQADGLCFDMLVAKLQVQILRLHRRRNPGIETKLQDVPYAEICPFMEDLYTFVSMGRLNVMYAAHMNFESALQIILGEHDAEDAKYLANSSGLNDKTALHIAVRRGHTECVDVLAQYGANLLIRDDLLENPLFSATYLSPSDAVSVATVLLKHAKAEGMEFMSNMVNSQNADGMTILHMACKRSNLAMVEILLKHGAKVSIIENHGKTPLHYTAAPPIRDNDLKIAEILMVQRADIHQVDNFGYAPVHYASDELRRVLTEGMIKPLLPAVITIHYCNDCEELHNWHQWHSSKDFLFHLNKVTKAVKKAMPEVEVIHTPLCNKETRKRTLGLPFGAFEIHWRDSVNGNANAVVFSKAQESCFPVAKNVPTMILDNILAMEFSKRDREEKQARKLKKLQKMRSQSSNSAVLKPVKKKAHNRSRSPRSPREPKAGGVMNLLRERIDSKGHSLPEGDGVVTKLFSPYRSPRRGRSPRRWSPSRGKVPPKSARLDRTMQEMQPLEVAEKPAIRQRVTFDEAAEFMAALADGSIHHTPSSQNNHKHARPWSAKH